MSSCSGNRGHILAVETVRGNSVECRARLPPGSIRRGGRVRRRGGPKKGMYAVEGVSPDIIALNCIGFTYKSVLNLIGVLVKLTKV